jgi:hypothetical protein
MQEEIIVVIKKGGEVETEVKGVSGKRCVELTEFITALGESTRSLKSEYFQYADTKIIPYLKIGK